MTELKITIKKIAHYPDIGTPQIYHGCSLVRQENGLNEIIDLKNGWGCRSPTHVPYLKFCNTKRHKVSKIRYLTHSFVRELKDKGQLFSYKCYLHLKDCAN